MAHHVWIGEIEADEVYFTGFQNGNQCVPQIRGTHFRLQIIRSNLGRRAHDALLSWKRFFPPAGKKEGHVGVLFGFRNAQLALSVLRQNLTQGLAKILLFKKHVHIAKRGIVARHGGEMKSERDGFVVVKGLLREHLGDLAAAVRTEVKDQYGVVLLEHTNRLARIVHAHQRLQKFIRHARRIRIVQGLQDIGARCARTVYQSVEGFGYALPSVVPVHGEIPSRCGGQLGTCFSANRQEVL